MPTTCSRSATEERGDEKQEGGEIGISAARKKTRKEEEEADKDIEVSKQLIFAEAMPVWPFRAPKSSNSRGSNVV